MVDPFPHPHATGMVGVSQSIGIDVDEKMVVGMDFWILQDLFPYGALERVFHLAGKMCRWCWTGKGAPPPRCINRPT